MASKASEKDATVERAAGDVGVPMLPGDPSERQGPEDALGDGPKRGDYRDRITGNPHTVVPVEDAKDGEARVEVQAQAPKAEDIGDESGVKGGVETS